MNQVVSAWSQLGRTKQIAVVLAAVVVIAGLVQLSLAASAPRMQLLYANLEENAAGEVIRALDQRAVNYEVRGNSIYVPAAIRDELRMALAGDGLPAAGGRGYELLDSLSGFGTTSQMFDAAYWRAKEGELARTIVSSRYVARARVHIGRNGNNPFQRRTRPTASVALVPSGGPITPSQANAIRHLVASAVAGMAVEDVAVIDADGNLIPLPESADAASRAQDLSERIRTRILRLVEARVGPGNAVVEVSVDTVTTRKSVRERRIDPESRVAISTDTEERTDASSSQPDAVTVASELPDGDAASGGGSSTRASSTRERVNYEVSETQVEVTEDPGAIRRVTVAVLVNWAEPEGAPGTAEMRPRTEEELASLRELIEAAIGFDPERGDMVTLKSLPFPSRPPVEGVAVSASWLDRIDLDAMSAIQTLVLALVVLVLGVFVIRPILTRPAPAQQLQALPPAGSEVPVLTGEIAAADAPPTGPGTGDDAAANLPVTYESGSDPVERLRAMIGDRQEETVQILRGWLEEERKETA